MNRHPDTAEFALGRQARQLFEEQRFDAACAMLASLAESVPDNPCVRMDLATVLQRCGRLRDATAQLLKAARCAALDPEVAMHLARGLLSAGEVVAARSCLDDMEALADPPATLLAEYGHVRWLMRDVPAARRLIDRAVAAGADTPRALHLQSMLMQFTGDIEQAGAALGVCLQRWPGFGDAALAQANLHRQTHDANHLDFLRSQLERLPTATNVPAKIANRAAFEAAMFKELDDLGQHGEAWLSLDRCNALMRQLTPYDASAESAVVDALIGTSSLFRQGRAPAAAAVEGPQPIFIVGMQRSGTTLLDRMISSHSDVASAGEITDFLRQLRWVTDVPQQGAQGLLKAVERSPDVDLAELGARYLAQTQWRAQGRRYFVDKLPTNIRMVAHIRQALPHARILHMVRNPMEVCFSNLSVMFGNVSPYSYDQRAMAHYYGEYARLVQHWQVLWPDCMLDVSYEELVRAPEPTLRKVLAHCGLAAEEACFHPERNTSPVATPSSMQVRESIHRRSLDRWHSYAEHLSVLGEALTGIAE